MCENGHNMNDNILNASKVFKVLSHPHRMEIVIGLFHDECNVTECQRRMGLPQSTISQHLKALRDANIIEPIRNGNEVCHKVVNEFVIQLINMIES